MIYGSVCSGIEAASAAWHELGWRAAFFSEIEAFPRAVLSHHYPDTPLHGDFTTIEADQYAAIDVLVGGTPCQSFSVAGLRAGLDDERGNLALEFCRLARRLGPRWIVWENVPGVLSLDGGRAFASILGGLADCGYGLAYRVLDAQFVRVDGFGRAVPQRRRRVFVVGHLGSWQRAAAVLFERASLCGNPAPRREAGQRAARPLASCAPGGSGYRNDADTAENLVAHTLNAKGGAGRSDSESETFLPVAHALCDEGFDASERPRKAKDGHPQVFLDALAGHQGQECVLWPFGRFKSGYGCVGKNGRAHRVMCEIAHGHAPDGADAAHSCGNRLCVNPRHLRWASRAENMGDAVVHGTTTRGEKHGASKLTADDVRAIFVQLNNGETHQSIADKFGVSRNAVTDIAKGKNWFWMREDGTGRGTPLVPVVFDETQITSADNRSNPQPGDPCHPLANGARPPTLAFNARQDPDVFDGHTGPLDTDGATQGILSSWRVRRLTPVECERLMGFPDGYTEIPYRGKIAADGPRYKALGNSMAVNVMRWIGHRIEMVETVAKTH